MKGIVYSIKTKKEIKKKGVFIMFTFDDIDMIWFANLKVADLKAELKKRGVKGYSKMRKAELQKTLVDIMRAEREEDNKIPVGLITIGETNSNDDAEKEKEEEKEEEKDEFGIMFDNIDKLDEGLKNFGKAFHESFGENFEAFAISFVAFVKSFENFREDFTEYEEGYRKYEEEVKERFRADRGFKPKDFLIIPIKGNEDKFKRMLKDLALMYHPDRPTGDSEIMAFVNEIKDCERIEVDGLIGIPIKGNEDKVKRMIEDLESKYKSDIPTGNDEMMKFVYLIKTYSRE